MLANEWRDSVQTGWMEWCRGECLLSGLYVAVQYPACRFHLPPYPSPKLSFRHSLAGIRAAIHRLFGDRAATPAPLRSARVAPVVSQPLCEVPPAAKPELAPAEQFAVTPDVPNTTDAEARSEVTPTVVAVPSMPERHATPAPELDSVAPAALIAAPDPDAERLLGRCALLEGQMLDLTSRLADMEQQMRRYEQHQYAALGDVVGECLRLRQEYLRLKAERSRTAADAEKARQADEDFDAYRRSTEHTAAPRPELDDDEQDELRRLYRAAAMRCHPDRAEEAERAEAHGVFLRVQAAYQARDLEGLRAITAELAGWARAGQAADSTEPGPLKTGVAPASRGLRRRVTELQHKVADLILAVQSLQLDPAYREALQVERWDAHFADARAGFEAECEALRARIADLAPRPA